METESIINQNNQNQNNQNNSTNNNSREYWKEEEENILRELADKAQCYELMHSKSHDIYAYKNTLFVIPVIIISTIRLDFIIISTQTRFYHYFNQI